MHVAAYSPRPGTLSYKWEDDVPLAVKKERLHAVEQVQERIATEINRGYLGRDEEVLIEAHQVAGGQHQWRGRNRTNKLVFCPATKPESTTNGATPASRRVRNATAVAVAEPSVASVAADVRPGDLVLVHIEKTTPWSLQGRLTSR